MPRVRLQYKYPTEQPGFAVLAVRWLALSIAMACFGWAAYTIYDQHSYQEEAETLFQQAVQDEEPVPAQSDTEETAKQALPKPSKNPNLSQIKRPVAKLDIPRLGVAGYVEDGLDAGTLRRAIGHAAWSAQAGQSGNVVLAAHRDTFFSGLRGVKLGDVVLLQAPASAKKHRYQVSKIFVVNPEDSWVMQPVANQKMLTLITCYPFSFVGHAPQRLIVQAQLLEQEPPPVTKLKRSTKAKKTATRKNRI